MVPARSHHAGETCLPSVRAALQRKPLDDSALANLLFRLWHKEQDMHHNRGSTVRTSSARLTLEEWAAASEAQSAVWAGTPGEMDGGRDRIVRRRERGGGLIGCSKGRRARAGTRFRPLYRQGTAQVCEVMHSQACGDFAQVLSVGGEAADRDGEDFRKFLQPKLDPFLTVDRAFAQQEGATDAAGDAVIPTGCGRVDEVGTSRCHEWDLLCCRRSLPRLVEWVKSAMYVLGLCQVGAAPDVERKRHNDHRHLPGRIVVRVGRHSRGGCAPGY